MNIPEICEKRNIKLRQIFFSFILAEQIVVYVVVFQIDVESFWYVFGERKLTISGQR